MFTAASPTAVEFQLLIGKLRFALAFTASKAEPEAERERERAMDRAQRWYFYFHVNGSIGIVQKIDFEIRPDLGCTTPKTARKVVLDNPSVCLSVWPSVLLSLFPRALTGVRFNPVSYTHLTLPTNREV